MSYTSIDNIMDVLYEREHTLFKNVITVGKATIRRIH